MSLYKGYLLARDQAGRAGEKVTISLNGQIVAKQESFTAAMSTIDRLTGTEVKKQSPERLAQVGEYNRARAKAKEIAAELEKLEAEEGDVDYDPEAVEAKGEELAEVNRVISRLQQLLYK